MVTMRMSCEECDERAISRPLSWRILLRYKAVFIAVICRSRGKIPFLPRIQIFGKGEWVLTRSTDRSFPQNQFERRPKTPPSTDRTTTVFGTSVLISRHGMEEGENKRRGEREERFSRPLESGTTPTTRLHIHREESERGSE